MNTKRKLSFGAFLSTFFIVLLFSISFNAVYAYFTSTATKNIEVKFATLTIDMQNSSGTSLASDTLTQRFTGLLPGDKISFSDINVANTGTGDCYVLVHMLITISATNADTLTYDTWYNLSGTEIETNNITETMKATYLTKKDDNETTDVSAISITWEAPGADIDDKYQGAEVSANLTAYAIQAFLPNRPAAYTSDAQYASYFICANYENFVTGSNS